jgi:hypothetical protein
MSEKKKSLLLEMLSIWSLFIYLYTALPVSHSIPIVGSLEVVIAKSVPEAGTWYHSPSFLKHLSSSDKAERPTSPMKIDQAHLKSSFMSDVSVDAAIIPRDDKAAIVKYLDETPINEVFNALTQVKKINSMQLREILRKFPNQQSLLNVAVEKFLPYQEHDTNPITFVELTNMKRFFFIYGKHRTQAYQQLDSIREKMENALKENGGKVPDITSSLDAMSFLSNRAPNTPHHDQVNHIFTAQAKEEFDEENSLLFESPSRVRRSRYEVDASRVRSPRKFKSSHLN